MLIISKFKDYYDTAIGVGGIDKSLVYQRITTEIEVDIFSKYFKEFCPDLIIDGGEIKNGNPSQIIDLTYLRADGTGIEILR
jgi:hypothetical protein